MHQQEKQVAAAKQEEEAKEVMVKGGEGEEEKEKEEEMGKQALSSLLESLTEVPRNECSVPAASSNSQWRRAPNDGCATESTPAGLQISSLSSSTSTPLSRRISTGNP